MGDSTFCPMKRPVSAVQMRIYPQNGPHFLTKCRENFQQYINARNILRFAFALKWRIEQKHLGVSITLWLTLSQPNGRQRTTPRASSSYSISILYAPLTLPSRLSSSVLVPQVMELHLSPQGRAQVMWLMKMHRPDSHAKNSRRVRAHTHARSLGSCSLRCRAADPERGEGQSEETGTQHSDRQERKVRKLRHKHARFQSGR